MKAFNEGLKEAMDENLAKGFSEQSIKADYIRWWDELAANPDPSGFGQFVIPRNQLGGSAVNPPGEVATITDNDQVLADLETATDKFVAEREGTSIKAKALDLETATQILREAGGDREEARRIAKERGFKF